MAFARKKQQAASNILVHIQALQEFSRKLKKDTVKYKFTDNYTAKTSSRLHDSPIFQLHIKSGVCMSFLVIN